MNAIEHLRQLFVLFRTTMTLIDCEAAQQHLNALSKIIQDIKQSNHRKELPRMSVYAIDDDIEFDGAVECAKHYGVTVETIYNMIRLEKRLYNGTGTHLRKGGRDDSI